MENHIKFRTDTFRGVGYTVFDTIDEATRKHLMHRSHELAGRGHAHGHPGDALPALEIEGDPVFVEQRPDGLWEAPHRLFVPMETVDALAREIIRFDPKYGGNERGDLEE